MKKDNRPYFTQEHGKIYMYNQHPSTTKECVDVTAAVGLGMKIERGEKIDCERVDGRRLEKINLQ